eukprot:1496248-Pleurochrysis_carterae.AAC.2
MRLAAQQLNCQRHVYVRRQYALRQLRRLLLYLGQPSLLYDILDPLEQDHTYFASEKAAAQAASPYPGTSTRRATVSTAGAAEAVAVAAASACRVSSAQSGWRTDASADRRAAALVSVLSCASLAVDPTGRSHHERGWAGGSGSDGGGTSWPSGPRLRAPGSVPRVLSASASTCNSRSAASDQLAGGRSRSGSPPAADTRASTPRHSRAAVRMAGAESAEVSAAAVAECPAASAASTGAVTTRPEPPSSASSARTPVAVGSASIPRGRSSPNSAARDDLTRRSGGAVAPASTSTPPRRQAGSTAAAWSTKLRRRPTPSRARELASPRASASAAFSARSCRIVRERGDSSRSARAVCWVARRGKRRRGERAATPLVQHGGDAVPSPSASRAAAALSAWSTNVPCALAVAGAPTAPWNEQASLTAKAAPAAPSASSATCITRMHAALMAAAAAASCGACVGSAPVTAASNDAWTASAAAWLPPTAATNCATSHAGRRALSSDDNRPTVQSSPARVQAGTSLSSGPLSISMSS